MQQEISFGEWLRKQRRSLDLSRQAFAAQVGCAEVTLRRIEAGTLKPSKELANILLEKLGILETERLQWISFARGLAAFPLPSSPSSNKPITNLPAPLTTFVGREKEQADVMGLITKHRLVTLTGSGGVGKTRLSIKVGEQVFGNYADGVWLVELAPILDPLLVPRTTAITIGLRDEPQRPVIDMLSDYLREKKMLLILDNCEHLLDACAHLADTLLQRCHRLKILATSREVLSILGEATYRVSSLDVPDSQQLVKNLRDNESVRLFEQRAQLVQMDFSLTIEKASSVAKICNQLDGIPLAIELAAARVSAFSAEQIAAHLQESFRLLNIGNRSALPRHQTLQATIDWSYDLLSPAEKSVFLRLSIFVNGWTYEAAEFICSDANITPEAILDLLIQLTNKSLVIKEELDVGTRYHMLETIRQYANQKLAESGESEALRDKHLDCFLNLAETAELNLIRTEQIEWLPILDADYENFRFALEWALSKETAEPSLNLCRALWWFWVLHNYWLEGLSWVKRALTKPSQNESRNEKVARARALYTQANLEAQLGNFDRMLSPAEASLALASEVSDNRDVAIARFTVGSALIFALGEADDQPRSLIAQSFADFQELNEPFWQVQAFTFLGYRANLKLHDWYSKRLELARKAGERLTLADVLWTYADWLYRLNRMDDARKYTEEADTIYKQIGSKYINTSVNALLFADIAWSNGDYEKAKSLYRELQEYFSLLGERFWTSICVLELGRLAMDEGDLHQAQVYLEQALAVQREIGYKPVIADCLADLSNLFYLQGNLEAFKQNFRECVSLEKYFAKIHKACILMAILGSLYLKNPVSSAHLMGSVDHHERESGYPLKPLEKRFWSRAETQARKALGDEAFAAAFEEGQKMSINEALDLALKTVEEM
jgi:predicted ATPase/transcriptional regulator with XRE-family HTH domain